MKSKATVQDTTNLYQVYKALGNEGRLQVYLFLKKQGASTNAIIAKNLGLSRSAVSKYVAALVEANLVMREKWFKTTVFKINLEAKVGLPSEPLIL